MKWAVACGAFFLWRRSRLRNLRSCIATYQGQDHDLDSDGTRYRDVRGGGQLITAVLIGWIGRHSHGMSLPACARSRFRSVEILGKQEIP